MVHISAIKSPTLNPLRLFPEQNVSLLNSREDRLAHDSFGSFWKQRPLRGNESIETVGSGFPNKILRLDDRATRDTNLEGRYKNASERTLMDYNGPVIMEDLDDTSDLANHIRIKRSEPIIHHQSNRSMNLIDSLSRNSRRRTDTTSIFGDLMFEGSRSDRENRSAITMNTIASHSRRKRGVLPKNGHRRKRVKGNAGHLKHHVEMRNRNKKHGVLKSHQLVTKKTNNPSSSTFSLIFRLRYIEGSYPYLIKYNHSIIKGCYKK